MLFNRTKMQKEPSELAELAENLVVVLSIWIPCNCTVTGDCDILHFMSRDNKRCWWKQNGFRQEADQGHTKEVLKRLEDQNNVQSRTWKRQSLNDNKIYCWQIWSIHSSLLYNIPWLLYSSYSNVHHDTWYDWGEKNTVFHIIFSQ